METRKKERSIFDQLKGIVLEKKEKGENTDIFVPLDELVAPARKHYGAKATIGKHGISLYADAVLMLIGKERMDACVEEFERTGRSVYIPIKMGIKVDGMAVSLYLRAARPDEEASLTRITFRPGTYKIATRYADQFTHGTYDLHKSDLPGLEDWFYLSGALLEMPNQVENAGQEVKQYRRAISDIR